MKILLIMDPGIPVPPPLYGGHERLVHMFSEEYARLGHEVSLLAGPNSHISGKIYSFGKNDLKRGNWQKIKELIYTWFFLLKKAKDFGLIHNFGRLAYLLPILNNDTNKIMTYGRTIDSKNIKLIDRFKNKNLFFTAPSFDCISTNNQYGSWARVFNAIDFSKYTLQTKVDKVAPLIFLSRLDKVKGCHIAIEIAKRTNNKLVIAGNISEIYHEIEYFKKEIEPHIDGIQIKYVGAVNDIEKNHLLGQSKAMLFPINIKEAFGMVMAESMACGTPVIAFNKGSVPEVVIDGVNGYRCDTVEQMIEAVNKIDKINRIDVRKDSESRFSSKVIAGEYLNLFSSTRVQEY
ncbi:MAG: glycosyltransferase family 4 protein [Pedobacter sp.]|nr:MAG: glycosyltransferase family 4 protein [Pedobacter sp.]